jgi:hypothetical protein
MNLSPPIIYSRAKPYVPSLYAVALEACHTSKARLSKLKLTVEEKQLLVALPTEGKSLIEKLNFIMEDRQKKANQASAAKWQKKTSDFFERFCGVVDKTSGLVAALLPQSPEYTITFGVLALLFKVRILHWTGFFFLFLSKFNSENLGCGDQE